VALTDSVSVKIRAELERQGVSARELSRRLSVSQPYIHRRLNGDVQFRVDELDKIAAVLGVPVATFLSGEAEAVAP
jgi:transcriptional regulator with XRE-family HTH domain